MHLVPTPSLTGKSFVTCVFGGFRLIRGMALSFHCWVQGPYHCVARPAPDPEATYLFLFNSMSFFFLLTLSAYIIRQLSCCILLRRFNCWGQMNKACIIESMGVDAWVFSFFCCIFFHELSSPMMIGQFSLLGPKLVPLGCSTKLKREIYFLFFHANFLLLYLIC